MASLTSTIIQWIFTILGGIIAARLVRCWNEVKYRQKDLPPGTMGWPFFGETPDFIRSGREFVKQRRARYGELFRSHILGYPMVISTDPKLNRYILMNEGQGLAPGYPQSIREIFGKWGLASLQGSLHKFIKGAMFSLINPLMIRDHLLSEIDHFMDIYLRDWDGQVISVQDKTNEMALRLHIQHVMSVTSGPKVEELLLEFQKLEEGTLSLAINLPGTSYRRGLQARKRILKMFTEILNERRAKASISDAKDIPNDMITTLLDGSSYEAKLTDDQILDLLIAIVHSGEETVATASMMAVKYLHDYPKALQELREEHFSIQRSKRSGEGITWDDYKAMKFTKSVVYETLRLAAFVNGVMRKTNRDMEMNGFKIPEGWRIYLYMTESNHDDSLYPDALKFNPWRWMGKEGNGNSDPNLYFMTFGGGNRLCPGRDLGTVEVSIFLHHFVTRYSWKEIGGEKIVSFPRVVSTNGLRIEVSRYSSEGI